MQRADRRRAKEEDRERRRETRAQRQQEEEDRAAREEFLRSPQGRARSAKEQGRTVFEFIGAVSSTTARSVAMSHVEVEEAQEDAWTWIEKIESEGWRMEHVGYVFRPTQTVSRDRFLASGQQEAISGEVLGIYIFRAESRCPAGTER